MSSETNEVRKFRSGLSLSENQLNSLNLILMKLLDTIPARFILLVDNSGQIVQAKGDFGTTDTAVLGSLIAADLAASQEIARLSGEYQDFQMILREGEKTHIIISEAGPTLTFLVASSKETPIGWARKLIQKAAREIAEISSQTEKFIQKDDSDVTKGELPDLFTDALDQIWKA